MRPSKPAEVEWPTRRALRMRLEEAGATLLAMPGGHGPAKFRSNLPEPVMAAIEAYGRNVVRLRPPIPSAAAITRMDEALGWVALIPSTKVSADPRNADGNAVLRRLVHSRLLVDPLSWNETPTRPRYLVSWADIATMLRADYRAVKLWHGAGLGLIEDAMLMAGLKA